MNPLDPLAKMIKEQKLAAHDETVFLTPAGPVTFDQILHATDPHGTPCQRAAVACALMNVTIRLGLDNWAATDGTLHGHRPGAQLLPPQELGRRTP